MEVVFRHVVHVVHEGAGAGRKGSRTLLFNSLVACVLNGWSSRTRNVLNAMVPFELGGTEGSRQQPRSTAAVRYYTKKAHHARIRHCHSPGGRTRTTPMLAPQRGRDRTPPAGATCVRNSQVRQGEVLRSLPAVHWRCGFERLPGRVVTGCQAFHGLDFDPGAHLAF